MNEQNEKFCRSCNVSVPHNSHCPLCGRFIREAQEAERYPAPSDRTASAKRILRFIFIIAGVVMLFVDLIAMSFDGWSIIGCFFLAFVWIAVFKPIFDSRPFGLYVLYDVLMICAGTVTVDLMFGFQKWSVQYVWPSAVIAGITVILFASLIGRLKWSVVAAPLLNMILLSGAMLAAGLLGVFEYKNLWFITLLYAAICVFGLRYFLRRAFNDDLNRLFHI